MLWVVLLITHGLLAFLLLGAITHQAVSVAWARPGKRVFVERFAAVNGAAYTNSIVALFIVTFFFGAWIYANYRVDVKPSLEELKLWGSVGLFELKEHIVAMAFALLPLYWVLWRRIPLSRWGRLRVATTLVIAFCAWWGFLVGHILNNVRGIGT